MVIYLNKIGLLNLNMGNKAHTLKKCLKYEREPEVVVENYLGECS